MAKIRKILDLDYIKKVFFKFSQTTVIKLGQIECSVSSGLQRPKLIVQTDLRPIECLNLEKEFSDKKDYCPSILIRVEIKILVDILGALLSIKCLKNQVV